MHIYNNTSIHIYLHTHTQIYLHTQKKFMYTPRHTCRVKAVGVVLFKHTHTPSAISKAFV